MAEVARRTEPQISLNSLPLDLLGEITHYLGAYEVVSIKCSSLTLKSKMERGGLASFVVNNLDWFPKSSKWLHPVIHSRLLALEIVSNRTPHLEQRVIGRLPSSLRRLRLKFPSAMAFLEPLATTPGVTKSTYESFKMVDLDDYYPDLTYLSLVDTELKWTVNDKGDTFVPTQQDLRSFVDRMPRSLTHLELTPFPSKNGRVEGLPRDLQSLRLCCEAPMAHFSFPSSLTSLQVVMDSSCSFLENKTEPVYDQLEHLKELSIEGDFMRMSSDLALPGSLEILRLSQTPVRLALPPSITEIHLGNTYNVQSIFDLCLGSSLRTLCVETSNNFDLSKLPRSLTCLSTGSTSTQRFRLGYSNSELSGLPPSLVSLTLVGHHRITHDVWFLLPKTIRILRLPDLTVNAAFLKLIPHTMTELSVGILVFSFNAGLALIEDCPTHLEIPRSVETAFVSKLVPKHVIFNLKRSECDVNDASALKLPQNLQSLTILGSQIGITDDFIKLLPRSLHTLRMPNQMTFTSRIVSYLPPSLHTLELDGHALEDISLPPSITHTNLRCSLKPRWFGK